MPFFHRARRQHKLLKKIYKRVKVCNLYDNGARLICYFFLFANKEIHLVVLGLLDGNRVRILTTLV